VDRIHTFSEDAQANLAHSRVGQFTLFYASGDRPAEEVLAAWALGSGPCVSARSTLEDRICAESTRMPGPFEPMHPWMGGDLNPFTSPAPLDECPYASPAQCAYSTGPTTTTTAGTQLCACACSPAWACGGTGFNYSEAFMQREFPTGEQCAIQAYVPARVMDASDASHVCKRILGWQSGTSSSASCSVAHGLLGGGQGQPATSAQLHGSEGVALNPGRPHRLLFDEDENRRANLWAGALSADEFLMTMPRDGLHPAHVAFGLDTSLTNLPLRVQGLGLLQESAPANSAWAQGLSLRWRSEAERTRISELYPQLAPDEQAQMARENSADWTCPIRKLVFWGSKTDGFGPITPNPVVASLLYPNLTGKPILGLRGFGS
jgi:hypothetical protein